MPNYAIRRDHTTPTFNIQQLVGWASHLIAELYMGVTMELKWWQHVYWSIKQGDWYIGFSTRMTWKDKPYFGLYTTYYNGHHWCLHLGAFYIGASNY